MAEFIMKELVRRNGLCDNFEIDSSATSSEEIGNGIYPPAASILRRNDVPCEGHAARRFTRSDYSNSDMVVVMEDYNLRNQYRLQYL